MWILYAWALVVCLATCGLCAYGLIKRWTPMRLDALEPVPPESWPKLSVVIAARNEGDTMEAALETLLREDYPNLELVVVDDRSSDATGAIVDRFAARDPRIRAIHVETLPEGWLGKVHALSRGVAAATGDWFLFTDADVHFAQGALRRAIAHAIEADRDFLAVMPAVESHGVWQEAAFNAFAVSFMMMTRADKLETDPDTFVGVGAFNLMTRELYERSEGLEWLKMEVADDVGLGLVTRRAGARPRLLFGGDQVRIDWYPSLRAMIRGLEKNAFAAGARFSLLRVFVASSAVLSMVLAPPVLLFAPGLLPLAGLAALALVTALGGHTARLSGLPARAAPLTPIGALICMYALIRSAAICLENGGIRWRDTYYSIESLRAGQRVLL